MRLCLMGQTMRRNRLPVWMAGSNKRQEESANVCGLKRDITISIDIPNGTQLKTRQLLGWHIQYPFAIISIIIVIVIVIIIIIVMVIIILSLHFCYHYTIIIIIIVIIIILFYHYSYYCYSHSYRYCYRCYYNFRYHQHHHCKKIIINIRPDMTANHTHTRPRRS